MKSPAAQWFPEIRLRTKLIKFVEVKTGLFVVRAAYVTVQTADEDLRGGCDHCLVKVPAVAYSVFSGKAHVNPFPAAYEKAGSIGSRPSFFL